MPIKPESELSPEVRAVLTRKRRKFAKLMATGQYTQAEAYEGAFKVRSGSKDAHAKNGHKITKIPEIQELIKQLEEESLPLGDLRNEQEQVLMHLKALAFNALDEKTRVTASVHLYHLLETHRETEERIKSRRPMASAIPVDAVVTELLQLAESQPAIELETVESETASDPTQADSEPTDEVE